MKSFRTTLDIPPSVNHCYVRRRKTYWQGGRKRTRLMNVLSDTAQAWMEKAKDQCVKDMKQQKWKPLTKKVVVELRVFWPNRRKRDVHNLHKLLADALEGVVTVDDKWMLIRDMDFDYDKEAPRVEVWAYEWTA